jgi:hypothetical protein
MHFTFLGSGRLEGLTAGDSQYDDSDTDSDPDPDLKINY